MVGAYSTFVNKGIWIEPIFITHIKDKNGVLLEEFSPKTQEAMSKKTSEIMVRLLQGVVEGVYSPEADKKTGIIMKKGMRTGISTVPKYFIYAKKSRERSQMGSAEISYVPEYFTCAKKARERS